MDSGLDAAHRPGMTEESFESKYQFRDKTTRRANHAKRLSIPSHKNIPLAPSGKSVI